ncbi:MAG: uroporphyrinogen decarboxylase, partial [Acidisphaera sp.]|nr:uroporphyrinogen decarboxylase [Acidisphaera sp.]
MAAIARIDTAAYRIALPSVLTDSTHGTMAHFELITARVRDADGQEGVGYTFTVGRNGRAVLSVLRDEIAEIVAGAEADLIEARWQQVWWATHYGGRGGPTVLALSAFDIALWDLKARRAGLPLYRLLGGEHAGVPCYAGGIDLELSADDLLRQTDDNLERGFRAIKMKVGSPALARDVGKVAAMRRHLGLRHGAVGPEGGAGRAAAL